MIGYLAAPEINTAIFYVNRGRTLDLMPFQWPFTERDPGKKLLCSPPSGDIRGFKDSAGYASVPASVNVGF